MGGRALHGVQQKKPPSVMSIVKVHGSTEVVPHGTKSRGSVGCKNKCVLGAVALQTLFSFWGEQDKPKSHIDGI